MQSKLCSSLQRVGSLRFCLEIFKFWDPWEHIPQVIEDLFQSTSFDWSCMQRKATNLRWEKSTCWYRCTELVHVISATFCQNDVISEVLDLHFLEVEHFFLAVIACDLLGFFWETPQDSASTRLFNACAWARISTLICYRIMTSLTQPIIQPVSKKNAQTIEPFDFLMNGPVTFTIDLKITLQRIQFLEYGVYLSY